MKYLLTLFVCLSALLFVACTEPNPQQTVRIGYVPGVYNASLAMMINRGWDHEAGFILEPVRFTDSASIVQSMFRGDIDMAVIAPTVMMTANDKGGEFRVISATMIDAIHLYSVGELADNLDGQNAADAIKQFAKDNNRKLKLAYVGPSTAPGIMIHKWVDEQGLGDQIEFITGGLSQVSQLVISGAVDLSQGFEPFTSIFFAKQPQFKKIASGQEMLPGQPLTGLGASQEFIDSHPKLIEKFMTLHVKATEIVRGSPLEALDDYDQTLNQGLLPYDALKQGFINSQNNFTADPQAIIPATQVSYDKLRASGIFKTDMSVDDLFDTSFYKSTANDQD